VQTEQLLEVLDQLPRVSPQPGFRPVHAKGLCVTGTFTATADAAALTRAAHMQGQRVPVTVRFSNAGSFPRASDAHREPRGMAVKFHLSDGRNTDLVSMSTPFFPVGTVRDFLAIVRAQIPDPATGQLDTAKMAKFLGAHPRAKDWVRLVNSTPLPASFARTAYHAIHAYRFIAPTGKQSAIRYSWQPKAGTASLSAAQEKAAGPDYLFEELRKRLSAGPVEFALHLQLAGTGDNTHDPTRPWPPQRKSVMAGTLTVTRVAADSRRGCEALSFDPTRLTDGIALTGDPILNARRGAYAKSAARRHAGG